MDTKIKEVVEPKIIEDGTDEEKKGKKKTGHLDHWGSSRGLFYTKQGGHSFESIRPDFGYSHSKLYELLDSYQGTDEKSIMKSIVSHLEFTLARTWFTIDNKSCLISASLSIWDWLIEVWNDT